MNYRHRNTGTFLLFLLALGAAPGFAAELAPHQQALREIYEELVEIDTTHSVGDTQRAAEAMGARLRAAGFPSDDIHVLNPAPRKGNLVARLHGTGARRPILLLAHLDVVEAPREDWTTDPFTLVEKDGYFYGRGTADIKSMAAIFVTNLIRYRHEGYRPERDIIVLLEADEETDARHGMRWMLANHRDLIDAELAINEGGGGAYRGERYLYNAVEASQKIYYSYNLEVRNKGGHSSLPVRENAITQLASALVRLGRFEFPVRLDEVNRLYFERMSKMVSQPLAGDMAAIAAGSLKPPRIARVAEANPYYNARLRTTCVATMLEGGHADNALPQLARARVNCRVLPGETEASVRATLADIIDDERVTISDAGYEFTPSPASPLTPEIMGAVEAVTAELWPGVPVLPIMSTGATDSLYLRNAGIAAYGTSGIFMDIDDNRAHGRDERVRVRSLYEGQEYLYRLVKRLAGGRDAGNAPAPQAAR
jgi:acetylornithine deacetylase/succinyl-diaminopimelate desuccinylase-like protein